MANKTNEKNTHLMKYQMNDLLMYIGIFFLGGGVHSPGDLLQSHRRGSEERRPSHDGDLPGKTPIYHEGGRGVDTVRGRSMGPPKGVNFLNNPKPHFRTSATTPNQNAPFQEKNNNLGTGTTERLEMCASDF